MTADGRHSTQVRNHILEAFSFTNATNRALGTTTDGYVITSADVGKVGYDQDTGTYTRLTVFSPLTWAYITGGGGAYLKGSSGALDTISGLVAGHNNTLQSVSQVWQARTPTQTRLALGLVIGTDILAYDDDLNTIAGLTATHPNILQSVSGVWSSRTPAQVAAALRGTAANTLAAGDDSRFRAMTFRTVSGTTDTLVLADEGGGVEYTSASAVTVTVPAQASVAWDLGAVIEINQYGAGKVTVAGAAGVTLRSDGAKLSVNAQYGSISLRNRGNNEWILAGDLSA